MILDDNDLVELQTAVFKKDLHKTHITALKQIVVNGDFDRARDIKGINFEAFMLFMRRCIQKMKTQTCWRLLKYYGYDSQLRLKPALWDDKTIA